MKENRPEGKCAGHQKEAPDASEGGSEAGVARRLGNIASSRSVKGHRSLMVALTLVCSSRIRHS